MGIKLSDGEGLSQDLQREEAAGQAERLPTREGHTENLTLTLWPSPVMLTGATFLGTGRLLRQDVVLRLNYTASTPAQRQWL